jgi:hypothetical protein
MRTGPANSATSRRLPDPPVNILPLPTVSNEDRFGLSTGGVCVDKIYGRERRSLSQRPLK